MEYIERKIEQKLSEKGIMDNTIKIGIIICDRYKNCAGGKCLKAMKQREGAFDIYAGKEIFCQGILYRGGD